jgi:hypothetical protein
MDGKTIQTGALSVRFDSRTPAERLDQPTEPNNDYTTTTPLSWNTPQRIKRPATRRRVDGGSGGGASSHRRPSHRSVSPLSKKGRRLRKANGFKLRPISAGVVQCCLDELSKIGIRITPVGGEVLVDILCVIIHANSKEGAQIRIKNYLNTDWASTLVHALMECGLIECVDLDVWKPQAGNFEFAKPRSFFPTFRLLREAFGFQRKVLSYAQFKQGRPGKYRSRIDGSTVQVLPDVTPSALIRTRLQDGSGLRMCYKLAFDIIQQLTKESDKRNKLHALLRSTGNQQDELHANWVQKEKSHRVYSQLCSIPVITRPALQSLDQLPVWSLDFSQFEPSIFQSICGESVRDGDLRGYLVDAVNASGRGIFSVKEVKSTLNPLLHGQTKRHIIYGKGEQHQKARRVLLHELLLGAFREYLPKMYARLQEIQRDPVLLQRIGADIFFDAYHAGLEATGVAAGIPMHDGLIFGATEPQAKQTQTLWEGIGRASLGIPIRAKLKQISEPQQEKGLVATFDISDYDTEEDPEGDEVLGVFTLSPELMSPNFCE